MEMYFGKYERFDTASKSEAAQLLTADNLIGDVYGIEVDVEGDSHKAWMVSRFGKRVGYFGPEISRKLSVMKAQGMECKAVLAFVAFTDHPNDGIYWGQAAVICFNPSYAEAFERFIKGISGKLGEGLLPKVDLTRQSVEEIIGSNGEWFPTKREKYPDKQKGTAIVKKSRSVTDKLVEQGRAGNKGCYLGSWAFLLILVAIIVFFVVRCS